ncbi:carbohydrate ABC transporter permease [Actinoplanes couchii]|uniref:ABC transporter permease n=1 Tax=Actinoplanes couchii TaxID=403638 RepID=A0ABQ3X8A0_9ACTN|nr:sugar ABC transporter permease [Actinoplanes couchii]MDR6320246.1 multiple sugar transport system permease protein [Actinoplanes couchii]GID54741.1 ABC transporter permease [Actinoplanes couchii]
MPLVHTPSGGTRTRRALTGWAFAGPATVLVGTLSLLPAGWSFMFSRTDWNGFGPWDDIGWDNYAWLARNPGVHEAAGHTLVFAAMFVPASVLLGMGMAVALDRRIRFIGFYRMCVIVPFVVSGTVTGLLSTILFDPGFGRVNALLGRAGLPAQQFLRSPDQAMATLCVIALWAEIGFTSMIYLAALQDVPRRLLEAAALDGAGRWRTFWYITVPELRAVTVFVVFWQTLTAVQLFDLIHTATGGGPSGATTTLAYLLYDTAFPRMHYGRAAALSYLIFAMTLLLALVVVIRMRRTGKDIL